MSEKYFTSHITCFEYIEVALKSTRIDDCMVSFLIETEFGTENDVVLDGGMFKPCILE